MNKTTIMFIMLAFVLGFTLGDETGTNRTKQQATAIMQQCMGYLEQCVDTLEAVPKDSTPSVPVVPQKGAQGFEL